MRALFMQPLTAIALTVVLAGHYANASAVKLAITADILSTNPGVNRDDNTDGVLQNIVEGLVGYGEGGTVKPLLAKSVAVSDDGMTYTFSLRQGVKYQDGTPFNADSVLWNWARYSNPKTHWRCLPDIDGTSGLKVTQVSAINDSTVVMKISKPSALFLDTLARTDCGGTAMLSKGSVNADGSWNRPIGTGPYELVDWKKGQSIALRKYAAYQSPEGKGFDGYVGDKTPHVDQAEFIVVPDASTVKAALMSGSVDITQVLTSDAEELKKNNQLQVITPSDASKAALLFQTRDPLFADVKFRQAIAAALDYKQLVSFASDGVSTPSNSAIFTASPYFDAAQKQQLVFSQDKARQLLKESQYKGQVIHLMANRRAPMPSYQVALVTQAMLQAVGINVDIQIVEWASQLAKYNTGDYQMMSFSYSSRLDPALSFDQFVGDKTQEKRKVWDNPQAIALVEQAKAIGDVAQRQKIFDQLQGMLLNDVPLILLYNGVTVWAFNKKVHNFHPWEGKPRLWGMTVDE